MAAGIIDHETGTRDLRRLSGLFRYMPITGRWRWWRVLQWRAFRC